MSNNCDIYLFITLLTCFVLQGEGACSVSNNMDSLYKVEALGCWGDKFNTDISSHLTAFDLFKNMNKKACKDRSWNYLEECAKLTNKLSYSVFYINYQYASTKTCLTGTNAAEMYRRYDSTMKINCNSQANVAGKTYVYSTIGTLSDLFTNNEVDSKRFNISQFATKKDENIVVPSYVAQETLSKKGSIATGQNNPNILSTSNMFENKPTINITIGDLVLPWLYSSDSPYQKGKEIDEIDFLEGNHRLSVQSVTGNILQNPSFENALVKNSLTGWLCQGQSNDPSSAVFSQVTLDHHGPGQFSGKCSNRVASWAGPGQYIGRFLKPGKNYRFSCWVRLETKNVENDGEKKVVRVWLRYKYRESSKVENKLLAITYQPTNDPFWKKIYTDFQVPPVTKRVKYVFLYIDGPSADVDIKLDDCNLVALLPVDNWKKISDAKIDKIRKRNVKIRLILPKPLYSNSDVAATRIQITQKNNLFGFGAALYHRPLFTKTKYQKFFLDNFQWGVLENEMKWEKNEKEKGNVDYKIPDKMVQFLLNNNKTVRGHCIFWSIRERQPKWLNDLPPFKFREALERRLDGITSKYRGIVKHWDVNNEMLHGKYYVNKLHDPSIPQWLFHRVKEIDPGVKLFVNDLDVVANSLFTSAYVDQIKDLLKQNAPVEALGAQGHFTGVVDPNLLKNRLDILKESNIPIWLTEVDILEADPHKRGVSLENIMRVAFSHPGVHGIIFWCFWDKHCWRGSNTGLVEQDDFKLTEAGRIYQDLRRQWTTNKQLKPSLVENNEGHFVFRGFHGDYDMSVYLPDGQIIKKNFTIKPAESELSLKVHVYTKTKITPISQDILIHPVEFSRKKRKH